MPASASAGKRPWMCPWCERSFLINDNGRDPTACPECTAAAKQRRATPEPEPAFVPHTRASIEPSEPVREAVQSMHASTEPTLNADDVLGVGRTLFYMGFVGIFVSQYMPIAAGKSEDGIQIANLSLMNAKICSTLFHSAFLIAGSVILANNQWRPNYLERLIIGLIVVAPAIFTMAWIAYHLSPL